MTAQLLEHQASPEREVLVDSFDELLLVKDGLSLLQTQGVDPNELANIQELRDEVIDDITKTQDGELKEGGYAFDGSAEALIGTAKAVALQAREKEATTAKSQGTVLSPSPNAKSRVVVQQRITSFFDPRLDEKPRRLFRR